MNIDGFNFIEAAATARKRERFSGHFDSEFLFGLIGWLQYSASQKDATAIRALENLRVHLENFEKGDL